MTASNDIHHFVVLVTGGRNFWDRDLVYETLDNLPKTPTLVLHGACGHWVRDHPPQYKLSGADALADDWAALHDIACLRVPAKWTKSGNKAGPDRNAAMVRLLKHFIHSGSGGRVIAFPGGKGTQSCINIARRAHLPITIVEPRPPTATTDTLPWEEDF